MRRAGPLALVALASAIAWIALGALALPSCNKLYLDGVVPPDGGFACPPGQARCGAACVSFATDPGACGACGHACAAAEVCSLGACAATCANKLADCAGACVDLGSDAAHCGACGIACSAGHACVAGACACPVGETDCGGVCVPLGHDPQLPVIAGEKPGFGAVFDRRQGPQAGAQARRRSRRLGALDARLVARHRAHERTFRQVLLVEHEETLRNNIVRALRARGIGVDPFATALDALGAVEAGGTWSRALIDLALPDIEPMTSALPAEARETLRRLEGERQSHLEKQAAKKGKPPKPRVPRKKQDK